MITKGQITTMDDYFVSARQALTFDKIEPLLDEMLVELEDFQEMLQSLRAELNTDEWKNLVDILTGEASPKSANRKVRIILNNYLTINANKTTIIGYNPEQGFSLSGNNGILVAAFHIAFKTNFKDIYPLTIESDLIDYLFGNKITIQDFKRVIFDSICKQVGDLYSVYCLKGFAEYLTFSDFSEWSWTDSLVQQYINLDLVYPSELLDILLNVGDDSSVRRALNKIRGFFSWNSEKLDFSNCQFWNKLEQTFLNTSNLDWFAINVFYSLIMNFKEHHILPKDTVPYLKCFKLIRFPPTYYEDIKLEFIQAFYNSLPATIKEIAALKYIESVAGVPSTLLDREEYKAYPDYTTEFQEFYEVIPGNLISSLLNEVLEEPFIYQDGKDVDLIQVDSEPIVFYGGQIDISTRDYYQIDIRRENILNFNNSLHKNAMILVFDSMLYDPFGKIGMQLFLEMMLTKNVEHQFLETVDYFIIPKGDNSKFISEFIDTLPKIKDDTLRHFGEQLIPKLKAVYGIGLYVDNGKRKIVFNKHPSPITYCLYNQ